MRKKIWCINEYHASPEFLTRPARCDVISRRLSENYDVVRWTASFMHGSKTQAPIGKRVISDHYEVRVVKSSHYNKHLSLRRITRDISFARNLKKEFKKAGKPDLIYTSGNPFRFGCPEFWYAKTNHIPLIVDMNDIWPEIVEMMVPRALKKITHLLLLPIYINRKKSYRVAKGLIATGSHHLEVLKHIPDDDEKRLAETVYNGIDVAEFRSTMRREMSEETKSQLPKKREKDIWCIFSGELGYNYDIDMIFDSARVLEKEGNRNVHFILTGTGLRKNEAIKADSELDNLSYLGLIPMDDLKVLYGMCDIGMAPYRKPYSIDMPDKMFDYYAAGLPVLSALHNDAGSFIEKFNTGRVYKAGDYKDFTTKLCDMIDGDTLSNMKINSYSLGEEFDINKQILKLLHMVDSLLNQENKWE